MCVCMCVCVCVCMYVCVCSGICVCKCMCRCVCIYTYMQTNMRFCKIGPYTYICLSLCVGLRLLTCVYFVCVCVCVCVCVLIDPTSVCNRHRRVRVSVYSQVSLRYIYKGVRSLSKLRGTVGKLVLGYVYIHILGKESCQNGSLLLYYFWLAKESCFWLASCP